MLNIWSFCYSLAVFLFSFSLLPVWIQYSNQRFALFCEEKDFVKKYIIIFCCRHFNSEPTADYFSDFFTKSSRERRNQRSWCFFHVFAVILVSVAASTSASNGGRIHTSDL